VRMYRVSPAKFMQRMMEQMEDADQDT
jgi:hypothetical protein